MYLFTLPQIQQAGYIAVNSTPSGAKIFLDGADTGFVTPKTLTGIATGNHVIQCSMYDYSDNSITVTVTSGQTAYVSLNLASSQFSIRLAEGWNFVSIPVLHPQSTNADIQYYSLFSNVENAGHSSWRYHGDSKNWEKLYLNTTLSPLDGIWVYSSAAKTIPVSGDNSQTLAPKQLYTGWNSIGYAGQSRSASNVFVSLSNKWIMLFEFNSTKNRLCRIPQS